MTGPRPRLWHRKRGWRRHDDRWRCHGCRRQTGLATRSLSTIGTAPFAPIDEDGSAVAAVALGLVVVVMLAVVTLDGMAYLTAASRAQAAADAAALAAAAAADPIESGRGPPGRAAAAVARANGAELVACRCPSGAVTVAVEAAVPVQALVATRFGPRKVVAESEATLAPPASDSHAGR